MYQELNTNYIMDCSIVFTVSLKPLLLLDAQTPTYAIMILENPVNLVIHRTDV